LSPRTRDFLKLLGQIELHPGLILMPPIGREGTWLLLLNAIAFLSAGGDPMGEMVNRVLEVVASGTISLSALSALPKTR
jgi:hypothetical protein